MKNSDREKLINQYLRLYRWSKKSDIKCSVFPKIQEAIESDNIDSLISAIEGHLQTELSEEDFRGIVDKVIDSIELSETKAGGNNQDVLEKASTWRNNLVPTISEVYKVRPKFSPEVAEELGSTTDLPPNDAAKKSIVTPTSTSAGAAPKDSDK
jgi:hypothetical protein